MRAISLGGGPLEAGNWRLFPPLSPELHGKLARRLVNSKCVQYPIPPKNNKKMTNVSITRNVSGTLRVWRIYVKMSSRVIVLR